MKAYFADLFPKGVRGVTRGEDSLNLWKIKEDKDILGITPRYDQKGERGEKKKESSPPFTP